MIEDLLVLFSRVQIIPCLSGSTEDQRQISYADKEITDHCKTAPFQYPSEPC